ncbi:MAG: hypothetical protein H8D69_02145 [Chloroflexi bacterium]|nr:hypothetical protein [Chloroflexota bacterium]
MKLRIALLSIVAGLIAAGCTAETNEPSFHEELRKPIRNATTIKDITAASVDAAVQVAQFGCRGVEERLVGLPQRILVSTSSSVIGYNFINSGTRLHSTIGPGGFGAESLIVISLEGSSESISNGTATGNKSFVFAETIVDPGYTSCTIEGSPFEEPIFDITYGTLDFEEYEFPY